MNTKQRNYLLEQYFAKSLLHYQIGNGEAMEDKTYAEKVQALNDLYPQLRRIEKQLTNV